MTFLPIVGNPQAVEAQSVHFATPYFTPNKISMTDT